jgi:uncharacterized protein YqiB (DUF1249 family)
MNNKITPESEAKRIVARYVTFLNYDQTIDMRWHDPSPLNTVRHWQLKKDAIRLSIICVEEIIKFSADTEYEKFQLQIKKELEKMLKSVKSLNEKLKTLS